MKTLRGPGPWCHLPLMSRTARPPQVPCYETTQFPLVCAVEFSVLVANSSHLIHASCSLSSSHGWLLNFLRPQLKCQLPLNVRLGGGGLASSYLKLSPLLHQPPLYPCRAFCLIFVGLCVLRGLVGSNAPNHVRRYNPSTIFPRTQ